MGNCTSWKKKNNITTGNEEQCEDDGDAQPHEDVTYASIDHSNSKPTTATRVTAEVDCDYATVNMPSAPLEEAESDYATVNMPIEPLEEAESDSSSREDCAGDDYISMN